MAKKSLHIFLGLIAAILIVLALAIFRASVYSPKNPSLPTADLILANETFRAELARSVREKTLGLSGREGLGENEAMLFIFDEPAVQNFWMKDMKFPIDIIWISGNRIVGFAENAEPESGKKVWGLKVYSSPEPADKALEVRAGTVARLGIKIGDEIAIAR